MQKLKLLAHFPDSFSQEEIEDAMSDIESIGYGPIVIPNGITLSIVPDDGKDQVNFKVVWTTQQKPKKVANGSTN